MSNSRKRPRDANQLAKLMIDIATGQTTEPDSRSWSPACASRY